MDVSYEFDMVELEYTREIEHDIMYKHLEHPIGRRRVDFVFQDRRVAD